MTPCARKRLSALLSHVRRVLSSLEQDGFSGLLADPKGRNSLNIVAGAIKQYCSPDTQTRDSVYPSIVASAAMHATRCFVRDEFSDPQYVSRHLSNLLRKRDGSGCRREDNLKLFFRRFRTRLYARLYAEKHRKVVPTVQ